MNEYSIFCIINKRISFFIVLLCDLLLYLLSILIVIIPVTFLLIILFTLIRLSVLKDGLMLLVHLFHLLLLVYPSYLLSSALDVLDVRCNLHVVSLLSQLRPVYLFGGVLQVLVFVEPRKSLDIDVVLLERRNVLA